ncbi:MAG: hypothetical protein QOJ03_2876 [Frankiaceae bacterium]|nr:hypothetical protein [Frankiaceae bacterium]
MLNAWRESSWVRRAPALPLLLLPLTGCTGGSSTPTPTPTLTTLSPTTSPTLSDAEMLQQVATAAAGSSYAATYVASQRHPAKSATWRVWRTPVAVRVDVIVNNAKTTLIVTPRASYSCRAAQHRRTCFRVAKGNQPIPPQLRLSAEQLFADDIDSLATHPSDYRVRYLRPFDPPSPGEKPGTCFDVAPTSRASAPRVEKGTYCFRGDGLLTSITYPSGSVVHLRSAKVAPPPASSFVPYSSPTPLPR